MNGCLHPAVPLIVLLEEVAVPADNLVDPNNIAAPLMFLALILAMRPIILLSHCKPSKYISRMRSLVASSAKAAAKSTRFDI